MRTSTTLKGIVKDTQVLSLEHVLSAAKPIRMANSCLIVLGRNQRSFASVPWFSEVLLGMVARLII